MMSPKLARVAKTLAGLVALVALPLAAAPAPSGPGSGLASITPMTATVATPGTWTIVYAATDNFTNGTLRITIPSGWTPPQSTNQVQDGYVTVTADHPTANPVISTNGQQITISIADLPKKSVTVVYGDDGGGAHANARATPPVVSNPSAVFLVESDPTGSSVLPIDVSPTVDLKPDVITQLVFTNTPFAFMTTTEGGPYSVVARDQYGNPSPVSSNQTINLSSTSGQGTFSLLGGASFSSVPSVTMAAGSHTVTFYYRDTVPGAPTLTASASTWTSATQQQAVSPGPPETLELSPNVATITAGSFHRITIDVLDHYGNDTNLTSARDFLLSSSTMALAPGAQGPAEPQSGEFFLPWDHTTPIPSLPMAAGEQTAEVDFRSTDANGGAPHSIIIRNNDPPPLFGDASITVQPGPISPAISSVTAGSPEVVVGSSTPVTVVVRDEFGNPKAGVTVTLACTGAGSRTNPPAPTDANGQAIGQVSCTVAETVDVSATANGVPITQKAQVVFVPGSVSAAQSVVEATSNIPADGATQSQITVTAKDTYGNPVSDRPVTLTVAPPGNGASLTQPPGVTDPNGQAFGYLRSTKAGQRTVTATIDGTPVNDDAVILFTPGAVDHFAWSFSPGAEAGQFKTVTLEVFDALDNHVTDYADTVFISTSSSGDEDWAKGGGAAGDLGTRPNGKWYYKFNALDGGVAQLQVEVYVKETITLTASRLGVVNTSGSLIVDHGDASQVEYVSGNNQTATVNQAVPLDLVVRVRDAWNNLVDSEPVTFGQITGGGSVDAVPGGAPDDSVVATLANGEAACDKWTLGQTVGANTVKARIQAGADFAFTATSSPGSGETIEWTTTSQPVTVGTSISVGARLEDAFGNPVPDVLLTIAITDAPDGSLINDPAHPTTGGTSSRQGTTDPSGEVYVRYQASGTAGLSDVVDATGGNASYADTPDLVFTSVTGGATKFIVSGLSPSILPGGQTFSFTIKAVDNNNNLDPANASVVNITPQVGSNLQFSLTDFGGPANPVTLVNGQRIVYGRGSTAGQWSFTVDDGVGGLAAGTGNVEITTTGVVVSYSVSALPASVTAGASFNVTVTALDTYGNVVTTATNNVNLDPVDPVTNVVVSPALAVASTALVAGQAVVAESYTKARSIKIRARDTLSREGYSGTVVVNPATAHHIVRVTDDLTGIVVGNTVQHTAEVRDIYDNPVPGFTVAFSNMEGGGSVNPVSAPTGPDGSVTVNRTTGTTVGLNRTRATIYDGNPANLETVEWSVQTVASGVVSNYAFTLGKTTWNAGELVNVQVQAYDPYGNLMTNNNSTVVQLTSTTGHAQYTTASGTLASGAFSTTAKDNTAEQVQLIVSTNGGEPKDTSAVVTVLPLGAYEVVKISGDAAGLGAGAVQQLDVRVDDQYGNAVPGETVTFSILSSPAGASLVDTFGDPNDGVTTTDANGLASVDLHTSNLAGVHSVRARILDGSPSNLETKTFTVTTIPGGIDHYDVTLTPPIAEQRAGNPIGFTIEARDAAGNLVTAGSPVVALSLSQGTGAKFAQNPITLANGTFTTSVTDTVAPQTIRIRAETQGNPSVFGVGDAVTMRPNYAYGTITAATVSADTITANGTSISTITTAPIKDRYGNVVETNTLITVATNRGTIISGDVDPAAGIQRPTDASGQITIVLQSVTTAGTATVTMNAMAPGTATGNRTIVCEPPAAIGSPSALTPNVVTPGQTVSFSVTVQNTSPTAARLSTATTFNFTDGLDTFSAPLASSTFIQGPGSKTLIFGTATIPAAMDPGQLTPWINVAGVDEYETALPSQTLYLAANSLRVTAIEIKSITPESPVVSRLQTQNITVAVENKGSVTATITSVTLALSVGSQHFNYQPTLPVPVNIPGTTIGNVVVPVTVLASAPVGFTTIDAAVTGNVSGTPVNDPSVAPYPVANWEIRSGAVITYVAGSLVPQKVSRGKAYGFKVQLRNTGDTTAELQTPGTALSFAGGSYTAQLTQNEALGPNATKEITFNSATVPVSITADRNYNVRIHLKGTENLEPFPEFDLYTGDAVPPDSVLVQMPADVVYVPGSLKPKVVSRTLATSFEIKVANLGTAEVELNPALTTLSFASGAYNTTLDPNFATISSDTTVLRFVSQVVDAPLGSSTGQISLAGIENNFPFSKSLTTSPDQITVQNPAAISIVSLRTSWPSITVDQAKPITVTMKVRSTQPAAVRFDNTSLTFLRILPGGGTEDRTSDFNIAAPTGFFTNGSTLPGNQTDSLVFTITDKPSAMASGSYIIEGSLCVTDVVGGQQICINTDLGGKGSLLVQQPGLLSVTQTVPSQATVTSGQTPPPAVTVGMRVKNIGEADVRLVLNIDSTFVSFSPAPGWGRTLQTVGPVVLAKNDSATVVFNVTSAGTIVGPATINGTVRGVEINSGIVKEDQTPPGAGSITVQNPANLQITNIAARDTVTEGQPTAWTIGVTVANAGGAQTAEILLSNLASDTYVEFPGAVPSPVRVTSPSGNLTLPGGTTQVLTFTVSPTPNFGGVAGEKIFNVRVQGRELNRDRTVPATRQDSVRVELDPRPQLAYVVPSLTPQAVEAGSQAQFHVKVVQRAGASTVQLDTLRTFITFGTSPPDVFLRYLPLGIKQNVIPGDTTTVSFDAGVVPSNFPQGLHPVTVRLAGTENGNSFQKDFVDVENVDVRPPTGAVIDRMIASRDRVSAGQDRDWTVKMVVRNVGNGDIRVLPSPDTKLVFQVIALDVTDQYTVDFNPVFEHSGTNILTMGSTDTLAFTVARTGTTMGNLSVVGIFEGVDVQGGGRVPEDTYDRGWAVVQVQRPADLTVVKVRPTQTTVTRGQTTPWDAVVYVRNDGEAAAKVKFDAATPDIRPDPGSGFLWTRPDRFEWGGDAILSGGEQDSLRFRVSPTGDQAVTTALHAVIDAADTNSLVVSTFNTEVQGGSGSVDVQNLGNAAVDSVRSLAPNGLNVNRKQTFNVRVVIANQGGANLKDVWFKMTASGGSVVQPDSIVAPFIASGGAFADTFTVTADDVLGAEILTVSIMRGTDANSNEVGLLTIGPNRDVTIQKRNPSVLVIESVAPSQPTVTRLQTQDWYVNVALWNSGGSILDVGSPAASDISFLIGASPLIDYVVQAPDTFLSGAPTLRLSPGEKDTLRYTVASTGADLGQVTIRARERWVDINDKIERTVTNDGSVTVVSPSGFFINTTTVDPATAPNQPQPNLVIIDSGQQFTVSVDVQNNGDVEDLDSVQVRLTSDYAASPLNLTSGFVAISKNSAHAFVFSGVSLAPLGVGVDLRQEILTSAIIKAKSKQSGQSVTPGQAVDNQEFIVVQKPASLSVVAQTDAVRDTVSTDQVFHVTGRVANGGVGQIDNTGRIALSLPPGFVLEGSTPDTTGFTVGSPVNWTVRAPAAPANDQSFAVTMTARPKALNTGTTAVVTGDTDNAVVDVVGKAAFSAPAISISSPAGATDDTLSTQQTFVLRGAVTATPATTGIKADLVLVDDPGFGVKESLTRDLGRGTGGETPVTWTITAPSLPDSGKFQVVFDGGDYFSGSAVSASTDTLTVAIVRRAKLRVDAVIARPPEATDRQVAVGSRFEIDAVVSNEGDAAVDAVNGRLSIDLTRADGYTLAEGTVERYFTVGQTITWAVNAPTSPAPPGDVRIVMTKAPQDENTSDSAYVEVRFAPIYVQTESVFITAENLSQKLGFDTRVVPRGTSDIDMLGLVLASTGAAAPPAELDTIAVSLLDKSGNLAESPSQTLGEFYALVNGQRVDGSNLNENPVVFDFSTVPGGVVLAATGAASDTIVFAVSVLDNAALEEMVISVESSDDFIVRNASSNPPKPLIPVVDKTTLGPVDGKLRSQSLVILSNSFEEYVHNYPNPFRAGSEATRIAYTMDEAGPVKVTIFDVTGEKVYEKGFAQGEPGTDAGPQEVTWYGRNMAGEVVRNGIYICQLEAGGKTVRIRIAVAK